MYTVSEEVKYFLERHLAGYVEKFGKGGLKMDVNSLRVFTDAVKCNPGILPVIMPHNVYHYVINNHSRPPKV